MTSNQVNTNLASDQQISELIQLLVQFLYGKNLEDYTPEEQPEIQKQAITRYRNHLSNWLEENKGVRLATQFKILESHPEPELVERFDDLDEAVSEAHLAFLEDMDPTKHTKAVSI